MRKEDTYKYVVVGLHSAGKSAFIRSFAAEEHAKKLKCISQPVRSTRFVAEYQFYKEKELEIEFSLKKLEVIVEQLLENIKKKLGIFDAISEEDEKNLEQEQRKALEEDKELLVNFLKDVCEGILTESAERKTESEEEFRYRFLKELLWALNDLSSSAFMNMNELMPLLFENGKEGTEQNQETPDKNNMLILFENEVEGLKNIPILFENAKEKFKQKEFCEEFCKEFSYKEIKELYKKIYSKIYEKVFKKDEDKIKIKDTNSEKNSKKEEDKIRIKDTNIANIFKEEFLKLISIDENSTDMENIIRCLFTVPNDTMLLGTLDNKIYLSGLIDKISIHLKINDRFIRENGELRYGFMSGKLRYGFRNGGNPLFTLLDSYGLDHGARDVQNAGILKEYSKIILQEEIEGVFLLGSLNPEINDAQSQNQLEVVADIVKYNLEEKPGLNIIYILNQADKQDKIVEDKENRKKLRDSIRKQLLYRKSALFGELYDRFDKDYITHSVDNFLNSICFYSSKIDGEREAKIKDMNRETYQKIDDICMEFGCFNIKYSDKFENYELDDDDKDRIKEWIEKSIDTIDMPIKLLAARKIVIEEKEKEYKEVAEIFGRYIKWNTANAIANRWNDKKYDNFTSVSIVFDKSTYGEKHQMNFDINENPIKIFEKHLETQLNKMSKEEKYFPFMYLKEKKRESIFIQDCMFNTIAKFAKDKNMMKELISNIIDSFRNKEPINRKFIESFGKSETGRKEKISEKVKSEAVNKFLKLFEEEVKNSFKVCQSKAVDRKLLLDLNKMLFKEEKEYINESDMKNLLFRDGNWDKEFKYKLLEWKEKEPILYKAFILKRNEYYEDIIYVRD